jgi:hypothetical protein
MSPKDKCNGEANRIRRKRSGVANGKTVLSRILEFPRIIPSPMPKKLATRGRFLRFVKMRTSEGNSELPAIQSKE